MARASRFRPGQVVTVFRSRLEPGAADAGYGEVADALEARARAIPGFVDVKRFTAPDGERVTIVTFADAEAQDRWRTDVEHRVGQERGRSDFYVDYSVQVATCDRVSSWRRDDSTPPPA